MSQLSPRSCVTQRASSCHPVCCTQSSCHIRILCTPSGMPQSGAGCDQPCETPHIAQRRLAALASSSSSPSQFHADLITCSARFNNTALCTLAASHQSNNFWTAIQQLHGTASNLPAHHLLVNTATVCERAIRTRGCLSPEMTPSNAPPPLATQQVAAAASALHKPTNRLDQIQYISKKRRESNQAPCAGMPFRSCAWHVAE